MILRGNYHTHTTMCDGKNTAEEMAEQACAIGFTHLGFSGHVDPSVPMDIGAYMKEIGRLKEAYRGRLEILCGAELDSFCDPGLVREAEYVIGSVHHLPGPDGKPMGVDASEEEMLRLGRECFGDDYYALAREYYREEAQVKDLTDCTFIGHFDLVTRFNDSLHFLDEEDPRYLRPALEAMEYLVSEDVPFEINCGAVNRGRKKELYPNMHLLRELHRMGGRILISSDAHEKGLLDGAFDIAAQRAAACGFTHSLFLVRGKDGRPEFKEQALDIR